MAFLLSTQEPPQDSLCNGGSSTSVNTAGQQLTAIWGSMVGENNKHDAALAAMMRQFGDAVLEVAWL